MADIGATELDAAVAAAAHVPRTGLVCFTI
jgi:hypothetical protein